MITVSTAESCWSRLIHCVSITNKKEIIRLLLKLTIRLETVNVVPGGFFCHCDSVVFAPYVNPFNLIVFFLKSANDRNGVSITSKLVQGRNVF